LIIHGILRLTDGTVVIVPKVFYDVNLGRAFSASKRFESLANDASKEILFINPSESGIKVYIIAVEISGFANAYIDIYDDVNVTSNGTEIATRNLNLGSSATPKAEVYYDGSYTPADKIHETILPGGIKTFAVGALAEIGETVKIPAGHNLMARITNKGGTTSDFSIRFLWIEKS